MNRILTYLTLCFVLGFVVACESTTKTTDTTTDKTSAAKAENKTAQAVETAKPTTIESDIQFIKEKYAIISKATNYRILPFETTCDQRTSVKLERRYNEKNELSYLQYMDCGEHGCMTRHHYYWAGQLIFIFYVNDYTPGSSHIIEERRTYFKNGQMISCLEKKAHVHEGTAPMAELLKKALNKEVDCSPEQRTKHLSELENLAVEKAKEYFCDF